MSSKKKVETTEVEIPELRVEDLPLSCTWIIIGPPASGKCLARDTPVLMYNGEIKNVQDIEQGDRIMGDDSTARNVLSTTTGTDKLYRITPLKGESYIVNEPHILCLKRNFLPIIKTLKDKYVVTWMKDNKEKKKTFSFDKYDNEEAAWESAEDFLNDLVEGDDYTRENILEISVKDYLELPQSAKQKYKGYKVGVDFPSQQVPFDSYLFGYWLGDGTSSKACITTADDEIVDVYKDKLQNYGLKLNKIGNTEYDYIVTSGIKGALTGHFSTKDDRRNPMLNFLKEYNILNNKHIPNVYLINDRNVRLQLLAGLLDSDGYLSSDSYYEIVQKNEILANDIVYLVRSLGFACYKYQVEKTCTNAPDGPKTGTYYRMSISGRNLHEIPVILKRKQISLNCARKDPMVIGINVEYVGEGQYYGFELDGNHRFLLGDFTVTHNTSLMENLAYYRKHVYPTARVFIGTEDGYKRFCKIFHPLYVSNYWDEKEEEKHVLRQRTCEMENGRGYAGNYAVNIIDDVSDDPKIYKTKLMRGLFKLGSQHWAQLLMIGSQYAIDMPPDIRKSVSYVALGREPELNERKKLYENFGGIVGTFDRFCDLMDQITGDYTFLVIKKRAQTNELEDCVSWFRTKKLGDWKFGSKEYREHGEKRYNKDYVEQIIM